MAKTCRFFGVGRSSFYYWREAFQKRGKNALRSAKAIARSHPNRVLNEIVEKVLHLRRKLLF